MFEQAKKNAPCIIFIDESMRRRHRGAGLGGGNDEREQTLTSCWSRWTLFEANEGVILIAGDQPPRRARSRAAGPGRFDRKVVVPESVSGGREQILKVHVRKVPLARVNPEDHRPRTPGFSGRRPDELVNEAR